MVFSSFFVIHSRKMVLSSYFLILRGEIVLSSYSHILSAKIVLSSYPQRKDCTFIILFLSSAERSYFPVFPYLFPPEPVVMKEFHPKEEA
jgi:hypothetical protein